MAVKIKLMRMGKIRAPYYRIVVADARTKRDGRAIETIESEIRALSRRHLDEPYVLSVNGTAHSVRYETAESSTGLFGGNSNWRGPIWFPLNYLMITSLDRYARFFGDDLRLEYPTRSGNRLPLAKIAEDLRTRLVSLFVPGPDGRRPIYGGVERLQTDPAWHDDESVGDDHEMM